MSSSIPRASLLTAQERHALALSASGLVSVQVADTMHVSLDVVEAWLDSAKRKLRARSKIEAVLIADRTGQLNTDT